MKYVIIGNSAAGISCIEAIRSKDKDSAITVISEEDYRVYSRCLLSYYLAGDITEEKLAYRADDFYRVNKVETMLGCRCEKIVPEKKVLKMKGRDDVAFDKLLIAAGARPNFPGIKGVEKGGVFGLRTIKDAKAILESLKGARTVAILGGGLIGLKAAYGLSTHGKDIRVIVKSDQVLSQVLDKKAGSIFRDWIAKRDIKVMTGLEAKEIVGGGQVKGVALDDGKTLDCEMVIVGKGVQPNMEIVSGSGIKVGEGIIVDSRLKTSADNIFAAGDVAQASDRITGESRINALWPSAVEEGRIAGLNMAGEQVVYDGSLAMNSVEFFGLPVISMGITKPGKDLEEIVYEDRAKNVYRKVMLKGDRAVGMICISDIRSAGVIGALIKNKVDVSGVKEDMLDDNFDFAKIAGLIKETAALKSKGEFADIMLTYGDH